MHSSGGHGRLNLGFLVLILLLKEIEMAKSLFHQVSSGDLLHFDEVLRVCLLEECEDALDVSLRARPRGDLLLYAYLRLPHELGRKFGLVTALLLDEAIEKRVKD